MHWGVYSTAETVLDQAAPNHTDAIYGGTSLADLVLAYNKDKNDKDDDSIPFDEEPTTPLFPKSPFANIDWNPVILTEKRLWSADRRNDVFKRSIPFDDLHQRDPCAEIQYGVKYCSSETCDEHLPPEVPIFIRCERQADVSNFQLLANTAWCEDKNLDWMAAVWQEVSSWWEAHASCGSVSNLSREFETHARAFETRRKRVSLYETRS
jgi:hypothetical protein